MSDEEQSADKNFLARWSQRKREAKQPDRDAPTVNADAPSGPVAESDVAQEFDLSSLPKLEDMTATTDITAFLRKGVPEHLRNAALRKSWALDPAIRNYVNPALDYAYDWNTLGGGSTVEPAVPAVAPGNETASDPAQSLEHNTIDKPELELPAQAVRLGKETVSVAQKPANAEEGSHIVAEGAEHSEESRSAAPQQVVRRHGSAKPLV